MMRLPSTLVRGKSQKLWEEAKQIIPGGTGLFSKRAERMLPHYWPAYFKEAKGITVTDLDGRRYKDFSLMGVGACILGYADSDVNRAVIHAVRKGSASTLNSLEEVELAELLCELHPWADMARFARTGGEAVAVAVRLARAHTRRDAVAFCGYHGWHDWYLSANLASDTALDGHLLKGLEPAGVPRALIGSALSFAYNRVDELERIAKREKLAAIIMEPIRHQAPKVGFLEKVKEIARKTGAVLIFDEISAGFRLEVGGSHLRFGVVPDMAVFGKAISNGFPLSAVIGKRSVMSSSQKSFISSTNWSERIGPVAALATISKLRTKQVPEHLESIGRLIGEGWRHRAQKHGLQISVEGPPALVTFSWEENEKEGLRTLFTQEMLRRGFLAGQTVYVSLAHTVQDVRQYLNAIDEVFIFIKDALRRGGVQTCLLGQVAEVGFKRLT